MSSVLLSSASCGLRLAFRLHIVHVPYFPFSVTGFPDPTLQWLKNDVEIRGAVYAYLDIIASSEEDCGVFKCRLTNEHGVTYTDPFEVIAICCRACSKVK